jgi:long-subunit fatty acid transport protein
VNPQNGQNGRATSSGFIPEDNLLLNNNRDARTAKNNYFILGGMGYAMRISEKAVFGASFVGRAGGGVFFDPQQTPFSFILPYDANNTPADRTDDVLVRFAETRRGHITSQGTANLPVSDSQQLTTPSDRAFFVGAEYSTDLKIPELGPAIGYELNDYLSIGVSARIVAGHFRFKQAVGTDATILKGTGIFNSGNPIRDTNTGEILTYGEVISGKGVTGDLGNVQFGYPELQGIGRLENSYSVGFGWGGVSPTAPSGPTNWF